MAAGIEVYKAGGHDGVICFGGGSALDGKCQEYMLDFVGDVLASTWGTIR